MYKATDLVFEFRHSCRPLIIGMRTRELHIKRRSELDVVHGRVVMDRPRSSVGLPVGLIETKNGLKDGK